MKRTDPRRLLALLLALTLCIGLLAGCGKSEEDEAPEETPSREIQATAGGSGPEFSEEFDRSAHFATETIGDTMGIVFNGFRGKKDTPYFVTEGSSITITARATTESESMFGYRVSLWQQTDYGTTIYVEGRTVALTADGQWYTGTIDGLTPGVRYKLSLAYDSSRFNLAGSMAVRGLASADADEEEGEEGEEG